MNNERWTANFSYTRLYLRFGGSLGVVGDIVRFINLLTYLLKNYFYFGQD